MKTAIVTLVCLCNALLVATTGNATQRGDVRPANHPVPVQCKMDKRTGKIVSDRRAACRPIPDLKSSAELGVDRDIAAKMPAEAAKKGEKAEVK